MTDPKAVAALAEDLREIDDGAYLVRTWVRHAPSGVVVLPGHPQLGGRYCLTDGGDWPCAEVVCAQERAARPSPEPSASGPWSFEGLTGDGWAILGPDDEERHIDWSADGYGRAIALDRADAERIVNALNASPEPTREEGLDVERLRTAMRNTTSHLSSDWTHPGNAEDIAAEYARLAATEAPGYTGPERRVKDDPLIPQWEERRGR